MCLLPNTPFLLQLIYSLFGAIQFSPSNSHQKYQQLFWRFLCLSSYFLYFYTYIDFSYRVYFEDSVLLLIGNLIQNVNSAIYIFTSYICFLQRSNSVKSSLAKLQKIDCDTNPSCFKLWRIIFVALFLLTFFPFCLYKADVKFVIRCSYPAAVHFTETLFLNDILNLIFVKFRKINQEMKNQTNKKFSQNVFHIIQEQETQIQKNIDEIENLSEIYFSIIDLTNQIIKHISISVLILFMFWFVTFMLTIYYFLTLLTLDLRWTITFLAIVVYGMYSSFWIFMVINSFAQIQNEANKTVGYIHEIWNKYTAKGKINRTIRHLKLISVRFLYNKLELSASGFFNLDWAFCHMVLLKMLLNYFYNFFLLANCSNCYLLCCCNSIFIVTLFYLIYYYNVLYLNQKVQ